MGKTRRGTIVTKNKRSRTTPNYLLSKAKNDIDHKQIYLLNKKIPPNKGIN